MERPGEHGIDVGRVPERDHIDAADPIGEGRLQAAGGLKREAGFADAPRPQYGEEPNRIVEEKTAQTLQFLVATNQRRRVGQEGNARGPARLR